MRGNYLIRRSRGWRIRVLNKLTNGFVYFAKQSLPNGTHLKAKNVSSEQIRLLNKMTNRFVRTFSIRL